MGLFAAFTAFAPYLRHFGLFTGLELDITKLTIIVGSSLCGRAVLCLMGIHCPGYEGVDSSFIPHSACWCGLIVLVSPLLNPWLCCPTYHDSESMFRSGCVTRTTYPLATATAALRLFHS